MLRLIQATERQQKEGYHLLGSPPRVSPSLPSAHSPLPSTALQSTPVNPESEHKTLHALRAAQNAQDHAPERVLEGGQLDAEENTTPLLTSQETGKRVNPSLNHGNTGADILDRQFIVTGIDALRRLPDLGLPNWAITRFEVDLGERVGFGFFSDVYCGTWRKHTVAVKVLAETTPRKLFMREIQIWKSLYHPNVLELFGASSASGEPPWFLVRQDPRS